MSSFPLLTPMGAAMDLTMLEFFQFLSRSISSVERMPSISKKVILFVSVPSRLMSSQYTGASLTAMFSALSLRMLGARIGADVPFCLLGGTALAQNIGELLAPMPPLGGLDAVVAMPASGVSTASAYKAYDALPSVRHPGGAYAVNAYLRGDTDRFFSMCANVFEQAVEVPGRAEISSLMRANGSVLAQMTGSGAAVFGLFPSADGAAACCAKLREKGLRVWRVPLTAEGLREI